MRGYTILYFDNGILITPEEVLRELEVGPIPLDVIIKKNSNGWQSPKIPITLIIRDGQKQIESLENEWNKGGILTITSFKKGNVSKLLFGNKNFSAAIIAIIEKLLVPPKDDKSTKKNEHKIMQKLFNIKPLLVVNIDELNLNIYMQEKKKRNK